MFVTGAIDLIVEPLRGLADEVVATRLVERDGAFTGEIEASPLVAEARAAWLADLARAWDADLTRSYAYADSLSDLPLLEAVGHPVAVNPDVELMRVARRRRWPMEDWALEPGTPRLLAAGPER